MGAGLVRWWNRMRPIRSRSESSPPRRWVIVDVESSGLDARRDRLLAIAAVAVVFVPTRTGEPARPSIVLADSFEAVLRQEDPAAEPIDKGNILIHGIGLGAQRQGIPPDAALSAWLSFLGDSPLVAYHSDFDQTMIDRACRRHLGHGLAARWLDLEPVAAVLHQEPQRRPLDDWLKRYRIDCLSRHQAAADTLATAQLMLLVWPKLPTRVRAGGFEAVLDYANGHRFIPGRH
jgi:DNA polymerase-3 subunit epsilon